MRPAPPGPVPKELGGGHANIKCSENICDYIYLAHILLEMEPANVISQLPCYEK